MYIIVYFYTESLGHPNSLTKMQMRVSKFSFQMQFSQYFEPLLCIGFEVYKKVLKDSKTFTFINTHGKEKAFLLSCF